MISQDANDKDKKWLFQCFGEMNTESIIHRKNKSDTDRISDIFPGVSIGPKEKLTTYPCFFPILRHEGRVISEKSMIPGEYVIHIEGVGPDGKTILTTKSVKLFIFARDLVSIFKGNDISRLVERDTFMKAFF